MTQEPLAAELAYFIAHQNELVERFGGKVIVIKGQTVIGAFDSVVEAVPAREGPTACVPKAVPFVEGLACRPLSRSCSPAAWRMSRGFFVTGTGGEAA